MGKEVVTFENIVPLLVKEVPQLQPLLGEHVKDNDEILAHVLFGDITRYVEGCFEPDRLKSLTDAGIRVEGASPETGIRIIEFLERALGSTDPRVEDLMCASFLENLAWEKKGLIEATTSHFGSNLQALLKHFEGRATP